MSHIIRNVEGQGIMYCVVCRDRVTALGWEGGREEGGGKARVEG